MICDCATSTGRMRFRSLDARRAAEQQKRDWQAATRAENQYARSLRGIGKMIGKFVREMMPADGTPDATTVAAIQRIMDQYATMIRPWAEVTATRMIADVQRADRTWWHKRAEQMSLAVAEEIQKAPTGEFLRQMLNENVGLITSLPREAGQRVHEWTLKGLETGARADEIRKEIMRTGSVTEGRAQLIARTEVARTASGLVESRSKYVGSEGYIWRTAGDSDVRNKDGNPVGSHRLLNGKFIRWDDPPVASTNGERAHAGQIYNCRCWPDPVIPMEF